MAKNIHSDDKFDDDEHPDNEHQRYMREFAEERGLVRETYTKYQVGLTLFKMSMIFQHQGYWVEKERVEGILNTVVGDNEKELLKPYALMLACLQGNAFPQFIEDYMREAKYFLIQNGWWDKIVTGGS